MNDGISEIFLFQVCREFSRGPASKLYQGMNRVPKFIEKRIADRRRAKTRNFQDSAPVKNKLQEKSESRKEEVSVNKTEIEKIKSEKKKERRLGKLLNQRNPKGQPNLNSQVDYLLKKFQT